MRDDCCAFKVHSCPNKCDLDMKLSRKELKKHLIDDCPETELICLTCGVGKPRKVFKKHANKTCLTNLQGKVQEQETILKRLKSEKDELMVTPPGDSISAGENPRYMPTYMREREFTRRDRASEYGAFGDMGSIFR